MHKFPLPIQDIKTKAELDLSGKELNHLDAIVIAALLPLNVSRAIIWISLLSLISLVDKGALTALDISRNSIPSKQEGELQRICAAGGTELAI
jgi:hypothetical protein